MIVKRNDQPEISQDLEVLLCWMDNKPLTAGNRYLIQINSTRVRAVVHDLEYKLDVNTLEKQYSPEQADLNDVVRASIRTALPVAIDTYQNLRVNGGAILIDETSNATVGACMIQ